MRMPQVRQEILGTLEFLATFEEELAPYSGLRASFYDLEHWEVILEDRMNAMTDFLKAEAEYETLFEVVRSFNELCKELGAEFSWEEFVVHPLFKVLQERCRDALSIML
ncbi:hypothetical protein CCB80_14790 [Armatimonadetes bacterium Uphvl-Ar1]|nr:hypothetical protein CCB80_14790 [Armatimonadetes bacterium Uphvl-Ar1]